MVHIIALITAYPGKRTELLTEFTKLLPLVREEKGCLEYQPVTDMEGASTSQTLLGADTYMVIEKWESMEDLRAHAASNHMQEYRKNTSEMVADRKIHILQ